jgi:glycerol-3-phosphate acyltransferase PlsY
MTLVLLASFALAYLLGSIPFGLIVSRVRGMDIRQAGSGNIGATNVWRVLGWKWGLATFLCDFGKGLVAVLIARQFAAHWIPHAHADELNFAGIAAAIGCILGHNFPVWLGFKGGKGVAVMIGSLLTLSWPVGLIFCGVWLLIALTRKLSSLAALTAAATAPIFAYVVVDEWLAATAALLAILLFYQHRENIMRLIAGTEPKIGSEKKAS